MIKTAIQKLTGSLLFLTLLLYSLPGYVQEMDESGAIHVFTIQGAIGPATSDYLQRGMSEAAERNASLFIIVMDTPGGLDTAMRNIIQNILQSRIPVVTYVSPQGARAASAGTYILYASHIAAMAPATNLGAATPVQIATPSLPDPQLPGEDGDGQVVDNQPASDMERKIINDATAYIRGLAELRERNAEWAVTAVTDAATLSASEALEQNVIDIVASDLDALLNQLDGLELSYNDISTVLETTNAEVVFEQPDWRTEFLTIITNPNLILILGMIGIYGMIIEFYNPGFGLAGITGLICLLLAGYGLNLLPINYAGLGLILFGLILIVAEAFVPSFGIMGVGGIISLVIGAIILVDTDLGMYQVSLPLISAITVATALLLVITLRIFLKIRHKPAVSGMENFIGHTGVCTEDFEHTGLVRVDGELWKAESDMPLQAGDKVRVEQVNGLLIRVSKV